ncbi:hypothetical protein [Winogradskyella aquimaris]|uniref:DUF4136 domain-containing protein n=1 Tax=Winogradskyella aquimaris TaxID=864074 RepID=A0ABU5ET33_9FLAO|nr:hypothetical protein [Winogradskyella aquimaris]MDY2587939.1 hypothetical protein [Winogradskyella aquimaris]
MKKLMILLIAILVSNCASVQLTQQWKSPNVESYAPSKILVVGLTSNMEAKQKFENELKTKFIERGTDAYTSFEVFPDRTITEKLSQTELDTLEKQLLQNGFDTIIFSKVVGSEDKIVYTKNFDVYDETFIKFKEDYLRYQDSFYNPEYYEEYTVYHAETSVFCICPTKDQELLWKGSIEIVDPQSIEKTVRDYINVILETLEKEQLINPIALGIKKEII